MKTVAFLLITAVIGIAVTGFDKPSFRAQVEEQLRGYTTAQTASDAKLGTKLQNSLHLQGQGEVSAPLKGSSKLGTVADTQSKGQVKLDANMKGASDAGANAAGKLNATTQMKVDASQSSKTAITKAKDSIAVDAATKTGGDLKISTDSGSKNNDSALLNLGTNLGLSGGLTINR